MTPAGAILAREIRRHGPIPFERFMRIALYHPQHGYYSRRRDPFGKSGDFYTAAQLQPVFGLLMRKLVGQLRRELGDPGVCQLIDLGAGREEMAPYFSEFRYTPVDVGRGVLPQRFCGVVFANEFFDALPVGVYVRRGSEFFELRVGLEGERFSWVESGPASASAAAYIDRWAGKAGEGEWREVNLKALQWVSRIARRMSAGFLLVIDYGYTSRELVRFPQGTLMSYRRHIASADVLEEPGERDITAHVNFTALHEHALACGFRLVFMEPLAMTLLRVGEEDQFAAALDAPDEPSRLQRRLQLKSLLYGMGECFRVMLLRKGAQQ